MRLSRAFFARPCLEVAPEMLGLVLVHELARGVRLAARIVEVEAYLGDGSDAASHAHRGPTPRSGIMFGRPGHFYVYRSMGLHSCVNVVCEPEGRGAAVLLRAGEPLQGLAEMRRLRSIRRARAAPSEDASGEAARSEAQPSEVDRAGRELTNGPGKLAQALGIGLAENGADALRGPLRLERRARAPAFEIAVSPRIGITKSADLPYRFFVRGSPCVARSTWNARARILPAP